MTLQIIIYSQIKLQQTEVETHQQLCEIQTELRTPEKKEGGGFCKETFMTLTILLYTDPEDKTEYSSSL